MDFYKINFVAFVLSNGVLGYHQHRQEKTIKLSKAAEGDCELEPLTGDEEEEEEEEGEATEGSTSASYFKKIYLAVYVLAFGADWLQVNAVSLIQPPPRTTPKMLCKGPLHLHPIQRREKTPRTHRRRPLHHRLPRRRRLRPLRRPARGQVRPPQCLPRLLHHRLPLLLLRPQ